MLVKNASSESITDIMSSVHDGGLKRELKEQYEGYDKFIGEISSFMLEKSIKPRDINFFKKTMLWSSIKMKTLFDNSRNQVAEMMINGTVMGIIELRAMLNESKNLNEQVKPLIEKLIKLEEDYEERLKKFL